MASPIDKAAEDQILAAFRERDIPVTRNEIAQALKDDGFRAWATSHLTAENLLTKDELALYTNLRSTGQLKVIQARQQGQPPVRPLLNPEIRQAIETLREATAATERQTETLRLQCCKLKAKMREDADLRAAEQMTMKRLNERHAKDKQRSDREVEAHVNEIELVLPPAEASIAAERSAVLPQVSGILKEHDKVLEYLEKSSVFSSKTPDANDDEQDSVKRMEALTDLLAKFTADTVRTRLDRVYLETLNGPKEEVLPEKESAAEEIEQEIGTLYADIDDLIRMIIQQQHEGPILRAIRALHKHRQSQSSREFELVCDSLDQITQSMIHITQRLKTRQSYRVALRQLSDRYREDLACRQEAIENLSSRALALKRQSLKARRPIGLGIVSASTSPAKQQQGDGDGEGTAISAALGTLLRQQDITVPDFSNDTSTPSPMVEIHASLLDRKETLIGSLERPELPPEAPLLSYLRSADTASQLISDALMADAKLQASLIDEDQDQELAGFARRTGNLRQMLKDVDLNVLDRKDPAREEFLRRWGNRTE